VHGPEQEAEPHTDQHDGLDDLVVGVGQPRAPRLNQAAPVPLQDEMRSAPDVLGLRRRDVVRGQVLGKLGVGSHADS
jgi:hypothetical protein